MAVALCGDGFFVIAGVTIHSHSIDHKDKAGEKLTPLIL